FPPMRRKTPKALRPVLDAMERRLVRSVTLQGGNLVIVGTELKDSVIVYSSSTTQIYDVLENGTHTYIPYSAVTGGQVRFTGKGGDDFFVFGGPLNVWADGGAGHDTIYGDSTLTTGLNTLIGGYGNDTLRGGAGRDLMYGGLFGSAVDD